MSESQFVDPAVSRRKFNREIRDFRSHAEDYGRRGWFLAEAAYPHALVILGTANTQPISILCGVWFDYSNYDAAPPSVRLVHPMTREPYKWSELPTRLPRMRIPAGVGNDMPADAPAVVQLPSPGIAQALPPEVLQALAQGGAQAQLVAAQPQPLMQAYGDGDIPFLCLEGVREYHDHPAHSGDKWESHRTSGAGRLIRLIEVISKYGLEPIESFEVQMISKIRFHVGVPPE